MREVTCKHSEYGEDKWIDTIKKIWLDALAGNIKLPERLILLIRKVVCQH